MTFPTDRAAALAAVARLADGVDNVAIALSTLPAGRQIEHGGTWRNPRFTLPHPVLEGHRFAITPIRRGEELLSWGYPFGRALRDIDPGDWIRNAGMIEALAQRDLPLELPADANFEDQPLEQSARLDEVSPAEPLTAAPADLRFSGYDRGERGFGTRNYVIVLAVNSHAGAAAIALAARLDGVARSLGGTDGVVPIAHTEGGGPEPPNNRELLERTLVGFLVHPNVAGAVVLDHPAGAVRWADVTACAEAKARRLHRVPIVTATAGDPVDDDAVLPLLRAAAAARRCELPLSALNIALQCGGSDAFSGISGNPLAGAVAREVIAAGGGAILAETDELIGAERYVLSSVKDRPTAAAFLEQVERFKAWTARHGQSAAGNPSGGNKLRGLYNITLKSIGAAAKKAPDVPLAGVVDYAAPVAEPGLHFMDSPGNDLESVAGQVASGSNLVFFVTGNGSITNFPFVPTVKFVTTTPRYELLPREMDVNAGRYLDGEPMDTLTGEVLEQTLRVASGQRTKGELAGHSQVSIWRDWAVGEGLEGRGPGARAGHAAAATEPIADAPALDRNAARRDRRHGRVPAPAWPVARPRIGLIAPTSLCSGQVAGLIAAGIERRGIAAGTLAGVVALPHTEGCGSGGSDDLYTRTLVGHVLHPAVAAALLLEHGCERTHNDYFRAALRDAGQSADRFGWASIQLDGGIAAVTERVADHFAAAVAGRVPARTGGPPTVGIVAAGEPADASVGELLASLAVAVVASGGSVIAPAVGPTPAALATAGILADRPRPTVRFAERPSAGGLHLMAAPTGHVDEIAGGLAAAGAELIVAFSPSRPMHAHPFVPVVQVTDGTDAAGFDLAIDTAGSPEDAGHRLAELAAAALAGDYVPAQMRSGAVAFQLTRGIAGVSL
jgi:altronate dehydratase